MSKDAIDILNEWDARLAEIGGCGDSGCVVHKPRGQHTNGGCRCGEDRLKARRVMALANYYRRELTVHLNDPKRPDR